MKAVVIWIAVTTMLAIYLVIFDSLVSLGKPEPGSGVKVGSEPKARTVESRSTEVTSSKESTSTERSKNVTKKEDVSELLDEEEEGDAWGDEDWGDMDEVMVVISY